jgi:hypothetical protein
LEVPSPKSAQIDHHKLCSQMRLPTNSCLQ